MIKNNSPSTFITDIRHSIEWWNIQYPLDKWYRDKFNIRYNSPEHLAIDVVDIRAQYEEDHLYRKALLDIARSEKSPYLPGRGQWLSKQPESQEMSQQQIDDLYQKVDSKDFADEPDEIIV